MITGAGSGLGLALAQVAASRGAHVVGVVRKLQHLAILKGEINNNCSPVMADINHPNAEQTISEHLDLLGRPLDLLVNCAGIPGAGAVLAETNLQSVEDLFRVHCIGALRCTRAAVKWLAVSPKPVVINISSRLGSINGVAAGLLPPLRWKPQPTKPALRPKVKTIAARPAAGPLTLTCELLKKPTTKPPVMPAIIPEKSGAPEARAIPRQRGNATRNTTRPDAKSDFIYFVVRNLLSILI